MPDSRRPPVDQERLWRHLRTLCQDIGPRLSGTAGDERAVSYIADHFRRCGARVEVQDFPCPSWEHDSTELWLLDGGEGGDPAALPAVAQTFSLPCDVTAPLAAVGTRLELDLAPDLEGKILLLDGEAATGTALDRNPTLQLVEERRAAAVVVASAAETVATKLIRDPFLAVPAAAVPRAVGRQLRERAGTPVRLRIRARRYASTGHNVIGHLPGRGTARIAVAAHYDTAAGVPGATDNASGTAAVLELCERFGAAARPPRVSTSSPSARTSTGATGAPTWGPPSTSGAIPRRSACPAPWWRRTGSAPPPGARGCA